MKHQNTALVVCGLSVFILLLGIKIHTTNNNQQGQSTKEPESTLSLGFPEEMQRTETEQQKKEREKREKERKEKEKRQKEKYYQ